MDGCLIGFVVEGWINSPPWNTKALNLGHSIQNVKSTPKKLPVTRQAVSMQQEFNMETDSIPLRLWPFAPLR